MTSHAGSLQQRGDFRRRQRFFNTAAGQAADGDVQFLGHHGARVRPVAAELGEPLRRVGLELGEIGAGDG